MQEKVYELQGDEFVYKNRPKVSLFSNIHKLVNSHFSETTTGIKHWLMLYNLTYGEVYEALKHVLVVS